MKTETRVIQGWYEMNFESPLDMLDAKPSTEHNRIYAEAHDLKGGAGWSKCANYDEFKTQIRVGADKLVNSVMRKADQLTVSRPLLQSLITVHKRQRCVADAGDDLDFYEWRRGNVDTCWSSTKRVQREEHRTRAACLYVNVATDWTRSPDEMEWRSAAIIKIAQTLASAGYSLEIVVGATL